MELGYMHQKETGEIIGAAMEVHNTIGYGLREKTYERALCVEFKHLGIQHEVQPGFDVVYREQKIDEYRPDIVVDDKVVVDAKTIKEIGDFEIGQMLNYLKITKLRVGLLINFSNPKLEFKRIAL